MQGSEIEPAISFGQAAKIIDKLKSIDLSVVGLCTHVKSVGNKELGQRSADYMLAVSVQPTFFQMHSSNRQNIRKYVFRSIFFLPSTIPPPFLPAFQPGTIIFSYLD